jgi:hypothetical protein
VCVCGPNSAPLITFNSCRRRASLIVTVRHRTSDRPADATDSHSGVSPGAAAAAAAIGGASSTQGARSDAADAAA